jgi:hypothetical protein
MGIRDCSAGLKMRERLAWLLAQADEYDSGRPETDMENGIFAARKCAEMAAECRRHASNLAVLIIATEEANV